MSASQNSRGSRSRKSSNTFTSRSGNTIKINRSLSDRFRAHHDSRARRRANRLATLPKSRVKRFLYRFEPRRLATYWLSRDGVIMALKITGIGIVTVFILMIGLFAYFRKDLPKLVNISGGNLGGSITYYDRTGTTVLWQDYSAVKRVPIPGNQISNYMRQATVAIEDKNFYHEGAFSVTGIIRAGLHDVLGGGGIQGASTITEQVVKLNESWNGNRTVATKVKEIILAVDLGREYSKDDILTGYLNVAPYGGVDYGVQAAARDYFDVDASQLTLAQSAMLAAIPQSPSYYSPYSSPTYNSSVSSDGFGQTALLDRQHYILDQMVKQGYITAAQSSQAKAVDVLAQVKPLQTKYSGIKAPYFVLAAKQELEDKYGAATINRGGWKVITTLDMNLQNSAEALVAKNLPTVKRLTNNLADEEATVAENVPTGQIEALVGGVDFTNPDYGQNNYAAGIQIPPGSSFKPYDYTTFINNNNDVGAGSVLYDTESPLPGYPCTTHFVSSTNPGNCLRDYDGLQPGPITLRYALGGSRNIPAVKSMLSAVPNDTSSGHVASINKVISTATALMDNPYESGNTYNCYSDEALTQTTQCYGASAIGDGAFLYLDDHVNGLASIARLGNAIPRTFILKITDSTGKVIEQFTQPKGTQVVRPDAAYIVDNMASDPNASYLPGSCSATTCTTLARGGYKFQRDNGWDFAVKTGTTNNGFDGLMASWSTQFAVVSWVGNHDRNVDISRNGITAMETLTEPLTRGMMEAAHTNLKPVNWTQPADIKTLPAFVVRNHIHYGDIEPSPSNDIFPSWYVQKSGTTASQTLDKVSNMIATSCTPALAKETVSGANDNAFSVDIFWPINQNSAATAITGADNAHSCSDPPVPTPSITVDDSDTGNQIPDNSGNYECTTSCQIVVLLSGLPPAATEGSSPYARYPITLNLQVGGQTQATTTISDNSTDPYQYTFTYTPTSASPVQVSVQAVDNALYSSASGNVGVELAPAAATPTPTQ